MSSTFTIEKGIAMPGHRNRYPFETMEPQESFSILGEEDARKVRNAAYQYAKKVNTKANVKKGEAGAVEFALRKVTTHGEGDAAVTEYRLWRVA